MTTEEAAPTAARARAPRRAPAELPFSFADRTLAQALAAERGEPAWLRDDRLAAVEAFDTLPTESNQLYTPYVDLRGASLDGARPFVRTASAPEAPGTVPNGTAGLIELAEDG
ncbi:MAG TPA: hypothetical protein VNH13_08650, partial [Candidatus Acidoferrales bacterium]|nr:hypothetical protein [Candidatus Acidoferrales bacterium]